MDEHASRGFFLSFSMYRLFRLRETLAILPGFAFFQIISSHQLLKDHFFGFAFFQIVLNQDADAVFFFFNLPFSPSFSLSLGSTLLFSYRLSLMLDSNDIQIQYLSAHQITHFLLDTFMVFCQFTDDMLYQHDNNIF